jgi:microcin C transport system substrate-binding protein
MNSGGVMTVGLRYFKLFYIIVILFLIAFISCSKDSDEIIANDDENIILDYSVHPVTENLKWVSNENEPVIASPEAKQGGTYNAYILTFPLPFRTVGPDSNNYTRSYFLDNQLSLISYHSDTEKLLPELATHWSYSKDGRTMYFKLNPLQNGRMVPRYT